MTEVWFIRHAQSQANAGIITSNNSTVALTKTGHEQAIELAHTIPKAPDLIVTTSFTRTHQTASPTLARFPYSKHEEWELHEFLYLSAKSYNGKTTTERAKFAKAYWDHKDPDYVEGDGAESFSAMATRVHRVIDQLKSTKAEFITVFTHGHIMKAMQFMLELPHLSYKDLMIAIPAHTEAAPVKNCSIVKATADASGVRLQEEDKKAFEAGFTLAVPAMKPKAKGLKFG